MPLPPGPVTSRRAALAVGAGGLLSAGCSTPGAAPAPTSTASVEHDASLAAEAATVSAGLLALVRAAGQDRPGVRRRLAPLVALHRAHLAVLPEPGADLGPGVTVPSGEAVRTVLERERAGSRRIRSCALEAWNGPLARLLASMAAGIAAHVEDLR